MSSVLVSLTINSDYRISAQEIAESVAYLFKNGSFSYRKPTGIMAISQDIVPDGTDSSWVPLNGLAGGE